MPGGARTAPERTEWVREERKAHCVVSWRCECTVPLAWRSKRSANAADGPFLDGLLDVHPLAQFVQDRFPGAVTGVKEAFGELTISLRKDRITDVCRTLRDDPAWRFNFLSDVLSVDFPDDEERFEVIYHLYSIEKRHRVRLKARVTEEDCRIESVTSVWPGANFMEREVYDLMGIEFTNHPDLRRILLTDDFDGHPLRKDYPTEGKGWRNTFEFLPQGEGPSVHS